MESLKNKVMLFWIFNNSSFVLFACIAKHKNVNNFINLKAILDSKFSFIIIIASIKDVEEKAFIEIDLPYDSFPIPFKGHCPVIVACVDSERPLLPFGQDGLNPYKIQAYIVGFYERIQQSGEGFYRGAVL